MMKMKFHLRHWLGAFLILLPLVSYSQSRLEKIEPSNTSFSSRVVFSLSESVPYHVFTLQNPSRLVVDFDNTNLGVNLNSVIVTGVSSIRSGHPKASTLRLVFDLDSPVRLKEYFEKNQLKLDIYLANSAAVSEAPVEIKKIPVAQVSPQSRTLVVVIDPGHGGKDSGAIGPRGIAEKTVVLAISKKLADVINRQPNMRAVLTRNGDYFIPLRDRLKLARKGKADLFVAVHADAYFNNNANGASVYALSRRGATSEAARWLAKRENYSELGGVDLGELGDQNYMLRSVLIDLAQTATIRDSLRLGTSILDSLDNITRLHYSRVEQAPFVVLKSPDIPSVLVETGFISNSKEELRLNDSRYQNVVANAMFNGISFYLKKYPGV